MSSRVCKAMFTMNNAFSVFGEMLKEQEFWDGIPDDKQFTYTSLNGKEVANEIKNFFKSEKVISVDFYRSNWFLRKVVAKVESSAPLTIKVNTRHHNFVVKKNEKASEDFADKICTVAHEISHVVDNHSSKSFGHGDNSPKGKEDSFPYWFGEYSKNYFVRTSKEQLNLMDIVQDL